MIEHTKLKALIARITQLSGERSLKSDIMHPQREWAIGLGVACILLFIVSGISLYLYTVATTTPELTAEQVDTVVPYRASMIETALAEYRARALEYQSVAQSFVTPTDMATTTDSVTDSSDTTANNENQVATTTEAASVEGEQSTTDPSSEPAVDATDEPATPEAPAIAN